MLRKLENILRQLRILTDLSLLSLFFCISLDHNRLRTLKGTLRSSRRVSLLNRHLGKLNILVLISFHHLKKKKMMTTRFNKAKLVEI